MGFTFVQSDRALHYEEAGSPALRAAMAVAGVLAIASSSIFLFVARSMGDLSTWEKVGGLIASGLAILAFLAFGTYCLKLALWMPRHLVTIDAAREELLWTAISPIGGRRRTIHPFDTLSAIDVRDRPSDDGPTTFSVAVSTTTAGILEMGVFARRVDAEAMVQRVRAVVRPAA